jgi:DNA-binding PadR family transcriptional regulator
VSLKYALLTMLARESFSGYDLITQFDGSVGIL